MTFQITKFLSEDTIVDLLYTLFCNRPIKFLRIIPRTGRSQVSWIHFEEISGRRMATFISFDELLQGFWMWLETVNLMLLAIGIKRTISEVVYHCVAIGDRVFSRQHGWVAIIDKDRTEKLKQPRLWVEWEDGFCAIAPCEITNRFRTPAVLPRLS